MGFDGGRPGVEASRSATPRMFDNPVLEALSRTHPAIPPLVYLPIAIVLMVVSGRDLGWGTMLPLFLGGYVLWTLIEYWGHRLAFHVVPRHRLGAKLHWIMHGVHHDHPHDPLRLVMPPVMSAPILGATYLVVDAVSSPGVACAILPGTVVGYVAYDMLHYHVHHHTPRTRIDRLLRRLHMHHHFRDDTVCFGVSAPWWDRVFATAIRQREKHTS